MSINIYANHAHVFQKSVNEEGTVNRLKQLMDTVGIEKAVCFAPFFDAFDNSEKNPNVWLHKQIKNDKNLYGFGVIDFTKTDLKSQVKEIHQLGLSGMKIHPAYQKIKIDGAKAFEVYEIAEELCLPISFHTGIHWHRISDYNMLLFDEVAYNFKNLIFSLEHVGGYTFFNEAVAVMLNNKKNVYAGLTSVFDRDVNRFWHLNDQQILDLIWLTGEDRSIFGLDFPYNTEDKITEAINKIKSLSISDTAKEKILGANLLKFLNMTDS